MSTGTRLFGIPVCSICQDQFQDFVWVSLVQGVCVIMALRWELAYTPRIPMPRDIFKTLKVGNELRKQHPEWKQFPPKQMMRTLPTRNDLA